MQTIYGWMTGFAALSLLLRLAVLAHVLTDGGGDPGRIGKASLGVVVGALLVGFCWMLHRRVRAKASAASKPFWVRTFEVF